MKIILKEQQLENLAYRTVLDKLNDMDFRLKKYKEFDFFPKGTHDADNGIEADYAVGEGWHILIGNSLFRSVKDLFNLSDDQTETAFRKALILRGLKKIALLHTLDFSPYYDRLGGNVNESFPSNLKNKGIEKLVFNYLDDKDFVFWDEGDNEFNLSDGEQGNDIFKFRLQFSSMDPDHSFDVLYINESIIHLVNNLFSLDSSDSRKLIIDWFNKKYEKNITVDDVEWFGWGDDEDDY